RADEHFHDLERLLTVVGLGDQEVFEIDAKLLRVGRVERVFRVHERGHAAGLVHLRNNLQGQRCLARGFRAENLYHASPWQTTDAECVVDAYRAGRDGLDGRDGAVAVPETHDRALAELLLDLADRDVEGPVSFFLVVDRHAVSLRLSFRA